MTDEVVADADEAVERPVARRKLRWERVFFALWMAYGVAAQIRGWWLAGFLAPFALVVVVELVRWRRGWSPGERLSFALVVAQTWTLTAALVVLVLGDATNPVVALLYALGVMAAVLVVCLGGFRLVERRI